MDTYCFEMKQYFRVRCDRSVGRITVNFLEIALREMLGEKRDTEGETNGNSSL